MGFDQAMKDIKTLFSAAKVSGRATDISAYTEAVNDLAQNDPAGYISQAEYIISSTIGLKTLIPFIESKGLPIAAYEPLVEQLEECVEKCKSKGVTDAPYTEALEYMESWHTKFLPCFSMYEYYKENMDTDQYVKAYYGVSNGRENRKLIAGMINNFGESAIPDAIVTAEGVGTGALDTLISYLEKTDKIEKSSSQILYDWVCECVRAHIGYPSIYLESLERKTSSVIVHNLRERDNKLYQEAGLMGEDPVLEYTAADIQAIQNYIYLREYQLTCTENESQRQAIQKEIFELYESYADLLDEQCADSVAGMLPPDSMTEAQWMINTRNKKTGEMPLYISRNHDLSDEMGSKKSRSSSDDDEGDEPTLDDFRRPSATREEEPASTKDTDSDPEDAEDDDPKKSSTPVANYYYYTYTNSLNKNSNSFNKDSSSHDDHSVTKKTDDHSTGKRVNSDNTTKHDDHSSVKKTDDHSSGKRVNSDNDDHSRREDDHSSGKRNNSDNNGDDDDEDGKEDSPLKEGSDPFDLDIFHTGEAIMEGKESDWNKEVHTFKRLFSLDLNKLGDVRSPEKHVTITIGGKKMKFSSARGYSLSTGKRIDHYNDVPTAIHQFNVNRDKIVNDEIGIGDALLHYFKINDSDYEKMSIEKCLKHYQVKADRIIFKPCGEIGLTFNSNFDSVHGIGLNIRTDLYVEDGGEEIALESVIIEAVGDADDNKPESDHPIKDTLTDLDRQTVKFQQAAKKRVQDVQNVGRAAMKPVNRTAQWVTKLVYDWKDADENNIKEKMADPHARKNIFSAVGWAIKMGSLAKAGLLLNPVFLFLTVTKNFGKNKKMMRLRNEMLGELKTELDIIDEKIKDAERARNNPEKYRLMRFKNELHKKYLRVADNTKLNKIL